MFREESVKRGLALHAAKAWNVSHELCWRRAVALIQVKLVEGLFSIAQKREMIARLTDTMVAIVGESMRQVTWVVLDEVRSGDWGIGGQPLCTEDLLMVAGPAPDGDAR